ncbi:MAG: ABC transporter ATP-binding protein [Fusobacteria bacterium]|nr:ABC transporter ATP-binding protein [Fusobacteriota bacterium]
MSVKIKNLTITYTGNKIVEIESLELESGMFHTIIGMNGSGKTTLIKAISSMVARSCIEGSIKENGIEITHLSGKKLAERIAYVPQKISIEYDFSVEELVKMGGFRYKRAKESLYKNIITKFGLLEFEKRSILTLSGGEFQRAQIARALYQDAPVIVLDEPTAALDIAHSVELYEYLKKLVKEDKKTVILISHDLSYVANYCDSFILMYDGKIVEKGKAELVMSEVNLMKFFKFGGKLEKIGGQYSLVEIKKEKKE